MDKTGGILDYREPEWVAKKLGLDKNTVYKYLQEGWLPGVQLGRKWLVSERLLAEHLENETRKQMATRRKELAQTPRLTEALRLASECAISRGQDYTGTEHLLVGMINEAENFGVVVLKNLGVDPAKIREVFESMVQIENKKLREAPLTDRARLALRAAHEQAIVMGFEYIGCETLLLGILLETSGMGYQILQSLGVTFEAVRSEILKLVRRRG